MAFTLDIPTILEYGWTGKRWNIVGDRKIYENLEWIDVSAKPTEQAMLVVELAAAKARRIVASKQEAMNRIYEDYPIWKQVNCSNGFYDESTTSAIKAGIQAVRTAQAQAEVAINTLETAAAALAFTW